mmetsp:Transcript_10333/g.15879  ORF Transcript_10333/g.15879 Transcript_10333/m.15879 type:complete len:333 (+) Transcript_10333:131-1129(+)|eukprot:CAMPEP_0178929506 /NCGR_PEP_ID=MMETSP0786-20121207/20642_1 /TAXON_ID=186022 /ORGANISM="Thalassionema frauenfeldii, Strain CCMP 1798" /LENGTH=332 /DNA_ID=CAMNT_0020605779 /DNA_START=12 /DNA_END=1010 /DNA_ORIENTATION=-
MTSINKIKSTAVFLVLLSVALLGIFADFGDGDYSSRSRKLSENSETKPKLTDHNLNRFIIVPEYKLMFCYIDKVGCTMFNKLFRDLRLITGDIIQAEANFQLRKDIWWKNTPEHHQLSKSDLEDMLADSNWTKAVFYRNPTERFLSAFRSKCEGYDNDGQDHCEMAFGNQTISFDAAMEFMQYSKLGENAHFDPMHGFCGGLLDTISYYDVVEELEAKTASSKVGSLLNKVGVPKRLADLLVHNVVQTGGVQSLKGSLLYNLVMNLWGGQPDGGSQEGHYTNSKHNAGHYLDDEHTDILRNYYAEDYELFNISSAFWSPASAPSDGSPTAEM